MPKKIFNFTDKQDAWLQKEAKRFGTTEVEILRRLLDGRVPHEAVAERKAEALKEPRYEEVFRGKGLFDGCSSIAAMLARVEAARDNLLAYQKDGVVLAGEIEDDYAFLLTDDKKVAKKHKMNKQEDDEGEFGDDE